MEMNRTLEDFKGTHDLSNNKLREYCKWYRVPKDKMKRYPHVRKCMLYAA